MAAACGEFLAVLCTSGQGDRRQCCCVLIVSAGLLPLNPVDGAAGAVAFSGLFLGAGLLVTVQRRKEAACILPSLLAMAAISECGYIYLNFPLCIQDKHTHLLLQL